MRRFAAGFAICIGILGCGSGDGGSGPPAPPPPPPPTTNVPATLTVEAGSAQQGEPATVLPVKPVVTVRNAAGTGVAGVSVTFAIDSGGGSLQSTSAVTAANGEASSGDWRLGSAEGRNVVVVTSGSLAPVRLVATATFATRTLTDSTLTSGTLVVTAGAFQGARLEIPAGAIAGSRRWTLQQESTAGWSPKPGVKPAGVALRITSTAEGLAAKPMMITLPASVVPGHKTFVVMRDPASGAMLVLNTVDQSATSITAAATHFDGTFLGRVPSPGVVARQNATGGAAAGYLAQVVVANIAVADLNKDVDTGFKPGVDDWEFRSWPTALEPGVPIDFGKTMSSLAYYGYLKAGAGIYNKHRVMPGVELSNGSGIAAAAYAQTIVDPNNMLVSVQTIRNAARAGAADQIFYDVLKANLFVTQLPQLLVAALPSTGPEAFDPIKLLTVYRTVGNQIFYADPNVPGDATRSTRFTNGAFDPLTVVLGPSGSTMAASYTAAVGVGAWLKMDALAQDVGVVLQGGWPVAGPAIRFPTYTLDVRAGFLERSGAPSSRELTLYLPDTSRMWVTCAQCTHGLTSQLFPGKVEPFVVYRAGSPAPWNSGRDLGMLWNVSAPVDEKMGVMVAEHYQGTSVSWLDFIEVHVKHWVLDVTPVAPSAGLGDTVSFNVTARGPTTPPHRFVWSFGDQTAPLAVAPNTAARHSYRAAGTFQVKVEMRRLSDDRVIAIGAVSAVITPAERWRLTSFSQASFTNTLPRAPIDRTLASLELQYRMTEYDLRDSLLARPAGGVIQVLAAGSAPQSLWRHTSENPVLFDWLMPLKEAAGVPTMYLTFPRGAQNMGGLLGTTGAPAFVPGFGIGVPRNPTAFVNQFTKTSTSAVTYTGVAASKALAIRTANSSAPSPVMMRLEVNATTTATGLSGTITFIASTICSEDRAFLPCAANPIVGELRRVYSFTATRF